MGLNVVVDEKAGSILKIGAQGTNKDRMVDFLNTTVEVLIKRQLMLDDAFHAGMNRPLKPLSMLPL